jgi:hypothetical protein
VIEDIFRRGEEKLKLFIINDKRKRRIYIFRMDDVIRFLNEDAADISFTKKGIIRLGKFITIQRKGGDGKHITIPKTDWNHPGNQLQFKFSPLRFAEYIELEGTIEFCIIDY